MESISSMKRHESINETLPGRRRSTVQRTQTVKWNEQLTEGWKFIDSDESIPDKLARYESYLNPTDLLIKKMTESIKKYIEKLEPKTGLYYELSDIKLKEKGTTYAVDLGSRTIVAVRIVKNGDIVSIDEESTPLITAERDLTAAKTSAYELFEAIADTIGKLPQPEEMTNLSFVCSFSVHAKSRTSLILKRWSKGLVTGRDTEDKAEGGDIAVMLQTAVRNKKLPFVVSHVMDDLVSCAVLGLTQCYELRSQVRFVMNLGTGFDIGAIVQSPRNGVVGDVVNMMVHEYAEDVPRADIDLETDWADGNINENLLEKLVAAKYLGEITRRICLKIYNRKAPKLAWSRGSLPTDALLRIVNDRHPELLVGREVIKLCWNWDVDAMTMEQIRIVSLSVLNRSASLVAASICAVAKVNNGLVPALEPSVVSVSGSLYNSSALYRSLVRDKVDIILGPSLAKLLIIESVKGGSAVGAAMLQLID